MSVTDWGCANSIFLALVYVGAERSLDQTALRQSFIAQSVSALDFNFERAVGGSILTVGKKLSLKKIRM